MKINREILMTIVKNSSNRLEGEQEILEINEQQLHLISKQLSELFSLNVVGCSFTDKEKEFLLMFITLFLNSELKPELINGEPIEKLSTFFDELAEKLK